MRNISNVLADLRNYFADRQYTSGEEGLYLITIMTVAMGGAYWWGVHPFSSGFYAVVCLAAGWCFLVVFSLFTARAFFDFLLDGVSELVRGKRADDVVGMVTQFSIFTVVFGFMAWVLHGKLLNVTLHNHVLDQFVWWAGHSVLWFLPLSAALVTVISLITTFFPARVRPF